EQPCSEDFEEGLCRNYRVGHSIFGTWLNRLSTVMKFMMRYICETQVQCACVFLLQIFRRRYLMDAVLNWTYISLIPPLITLILVLLTRRVDLSLGIGILTSAIVITNGDIGETLSKIWHTFIDLIIEDGWLNTWSAYILIFLALLGIMSAFMIMSGGARGFTSYVMTKVKRRTGALLLSGVLGIIIFIDDYFSAIITPQVSKPLTDKYRVSRAKLAYLVDTTASPIAVIMPVSSWGATIMGLTAPLLVAAGLTHITPFESFLYIIPLNFYSLSALLLMFVVIFTNFDIFGMKKEETRAIQDG